MSHPGSVPLGAQPDTPRHTQCPAGPWKAEAVARWTSHPGNKETDPLVPSVPAFVQCTWLSKPLTLPWHLPGSWGAPCTHLCSPRNRFCKGHTFLFFILIFLHSTTSAWHSQPFSRSGWMHSQPIPAVTNSPRSSGPLPPPSWDLLPVPSQQVQLCCSPAEPRNWNCS